MTTAARPGRMIVIEGIDGSGKSTQVALLARRLRMEGLPTRTTHEPSSGPIGGLIRQALTGRVPFEEHVLAYLYAADRLDHVVNPHDGMLSTLRSGTHVVCDRYHLSTYAYHTDALDLSTMVQLNALATGMLLPDLVVFLDVSPETGLARHASVGGGGDRYERLDMLHRVRAGYERAFTIVAPPTRLVVIDGEQSVDAVADAIFDAVMPLFRPLGGSATVSARGLPL